MTTDSTSSPVPDVTAAPPAQPLGADSTDHLVIDDADTARIDPPHRASAWQRFPLRLPESWTRRTAPWRQVVQRRRIMLHDELVRLDLEKDQDAERHYLIDELLADTCRASRARSSIATWWGGTEIERAWASLREVEQRTIDLLPDDEVVIRAVAALEATSNRLSTSDRRRTQLEELIDVAGGQPNVAPQLLRQLRAGVIAVLRGSHANADLMHQQARGLRNQILLASLITATTAALTVLAQAHLSSAPFLEQPETWTNAPWQFLTVVMVLGCVGALFTAIPAMSEVPTDDSPFNLPLQQAILKIVFGAVAAVAGMAIVSTNTVQSDLTDSMPGVVVLAVAFGAGQQIVTRFVDRHADDLLNTRASSPDSSPPKKGRTAARSSSRVSGPAHL